MKKTSGVMETKQTKLEELLREVKSRISLQNDQRQYSSLTISVAGDLIDSVRKTYEFAKKAHEGQFRADRKTPYITHPRAVAHRLATEFAQYGATEYGGINFPDSCRYVAFVQAGLLHDVVEDCGIALEEIANNFGNEVSFLVDGMTKVVREKDEKIEADKDATLRKIAAYGFKDPRLFLIKLCDVAHNSSGIADLSEEIQKRFAKYGVEFYAPLAERLGFEKLAEEIKKLNSKYYEGDGKSILFKYFGNSGELGEAHTFFHSSEELS